jgi:4-amino-4-deoxy-L-arabinose transferase-like glycosyltransferase
LSAVAVPLAEDSPRRRLAPASILFWTVLISTVLRLAAAAAVGYGYGEGYYLATARHLALSYFDQPPLSLWMGWAAIRLVGVADPLLVRLPFILLFAGTTWAMYRLTADLFGARAGAFAALLLNLSPVFSVSVASWVQPDGPLMFFLLVAAMPIMRLAFGKPQSPGLVWAAAGAAFGLAFLSKYHAALTLAGLFLFALTARGHRAWFFRPGLLLAAIIAALICAPVILWNAENHWVSFVFQGNRIQQDVGLHWDWLVRSVAGQALLIGIFIWPGTIYVFWLGLRAGPRDPRSWLLVCLAFVPILVFTAAAVWAPLGYHFHWQAPGYLFLFPLLGRLTAEQIDEGRKAPRFWMYMAGIGLVVTVAALGAQARTGWMGKVMPAAVTAEVAHAQNPTRELLTWTELRPALAERGLLDRPRLFAIAPQWHQAGKLDTQIGDRLPVVCLCGDPRNIAFGWNTNDFLGWDGLVIGTDNFLGNVAKDYGPYFRSIEELAPVDIKLGGVTDVTLRIYLAHDYYRPYPMPYGPAMSAGREPG